MADQLACFEELCLRVHDDCQLVVCHWTVLTAAFRLSDTRCRSRALIADAAMPASTALYCCRWWYSVTSVLKTTMCNGSCSSPTSWFCLSASSTSCENTTHAPIYHAIKMPITFTDNQRQNLRMKSNHSFNIQWVVTVVCKSKISVSAVFFACSGPDCLSHLWERKTAAALYRQRAWAQIWQAVVLNIIYSLCVMWPTTATLNFDLYVIRKLAGFFVYIHVHCLWMSVATLKVIIVSNVTQHCVVWLEK